MDEILISTQSQSMHLRQLTKHKCTGTESWKSDGGEVWANGVGEEADQGRRKRPATEEGRGERPATEAARSRVTKPYLNALPVNMAPPVQVVTTNVEVDALHRMLGIPGRWSPSFT
jgi:hypothetical protein